MNEEAPKTAEVEKSLDVILTSDEIISKTEALRKIITGLRIRQINFIDEKVKEHGELASSLPELFTLLREAETAKVLLISMKEGGQFSQSDETELRETENLIAICKAQRNAEEVKLGLLFSQPDVSDHIVEGAFDRLDQEKKEEKIIDGVEVLKKEVDKIISKIDESFDENGSVLDPKIDDTVYVMIKEISTRAYELLEKNGITQINPTYHTDAPKILFLYFDRLLKTLGGFIEVKNEKDIIANDTPKKRAIRNKWYNAGPSDIPFYHAFVKHF